MGNFFLGANWISILLFLVLTALTLSVTLYFYFRIAAKRPTSYSIPKNRPYCMLAFTGEPAFSEDACSPWFFAMRKEGERLARKKIQKVVFINGTFVGDDPFDFFKLAANILPGKLELSVQALKVLYNNHKQQLFRNAGFFNQDYVHLFSQATGLQGSICEWSSGNYHYARLLGLFSLLEHLNHDDFLKQERILFIAHSHGGQILALLSQVLHSSTSMRNYFAIAREVQDIPVNLFHVIKRLRQMKLDFVTMGTPVRYPFQTHKRIKLLHIVNHRGATPTFGNFSGMLNARDGDYIQQLGINGSDITSPIRTHARLSKKLDLYLGKGVDRKAWKIGLKEIFRLAPQGANLLVDYQDKSSKVFSHAFGHAVYTQKRCMHFNTKVIANFLENRIEFL